MFELVESSWINAVNYFAEEESLEINLSNGRTYVYFGVSKDVYDEMLAAQSKGKFYNDKIKGLYNCLRLDSLSPQNAEI